MEIAEIALAVFTASGVTYGAFRSYRIHRTPKLEREMPVSLWLRADRQPEEMRCVVLVFDNRGCLARKFPQAEYSYRKDRYRIKCAAIRGEYSFCVLLCTAPLNLSGILRLEDARRLAAITPGARVAETGVLTVAPGKATYELQAVDNLLPQELPTDSGLSLNEVLPHEVVTDAMAKELVVDLHHYSHDWTPGVVGYTDEDSDGYTASDTAQWISPRRRNRELILQLRTNFGSQERRGWVELHTPDGTTYRLPVRQRVMGEHPTLTVSQHIHVSPGMKHEAVELTVTPNEDTSQWAIRRVETSDGGRWWTVQPSVGTPLTGVQTLRVHLEAKPANVPSRTAVVTLETGTYPFNQTTDVCLMQGVCFDYYIEYPPNDPCTRHKDVIETPLGYLPGDAPKRYIIRVDSNQTWRLVKDEAVDWVQVGEVNWVPGSHSGLFAVEVASNAENEVRGGLPAARHTMLSLINDTGLVKDIFIYQGGYVRIRGILWLDRNLPLPEIAVPLGLSEEDKHRTWGTYYQFGKPTNKWKEEVISSTQSWHSGTEETPGKRTDIDPSPQGWRVPSVLELSTLLQRQVSSVNDLLRGDGKEYVCLLSDDGVPFFLPLCGHLSHINGSQIGIPRGNRYWCGTSQSPIYGHSLCIEASRQMSLTHDMKKYGFPVRSVLAGFLLCCLVLFGACTPDTDDIRLPARHALLVYMAGDNNLSRETTQKIQAIAEGFHDEDSHLLIYQDYNHAAAGEQASPLLLKLEATGANSPARIDTLERYAPENSASAEVFGRVLRQVAQEYPAESHGLLLFSHGTGWLPQGTFACPRSITTDGKNEMEVRDFAAAIPDGHFDYIVFEACLMAGVEVAYELRHKTRYLLASSAEIISPGFTPVYPELIPYLFESPANLTGFARRFHTYVDGLKGLYRSSTLSVIATEGIEELARQVVPVLHQPVQPALEAVQEFNRNASLLYFDLGHYMELAATPEQYRQFEQVLGRVVLYQAATPQFVGTPVKHHCGLTVYLPQEKYPYLNAEYTKYQFGNR